jgi:serine/threonine protein phosphatase PrpC
VITSERSHVTAVALTHPGETGKNNEDCYSVTTYTVEPDGTPSILGVVADGIGGHQAGEVAAQLTADTTVKVLSACSAHEPVQQLRSAIIEAGRAVSRAAREKPELAGMGSTIAVIWIIGDRLYTATVGDSRIYLLQDGVLRQVSIDHTWIQEALDHDIISPEEVKDHPNVHVLRRHIGGAQDPAVDARLRLSAEETDEQSEANQGLTLNPGDQVMACSDGLTDLVKNSEIQQALTSRSPKEAAAQLVRLARERGGYDNITVVLLAVPTRKRRTSVGRKLIPVFLVGLASILGLLGLVLAAAWWFGFLPQARATPTAAPFPAVATVFAPGSVETQAPSAGETGPSQVPPSADMVEASATYTAFPLPTVPAISPTPVPPG